MKTTLTHKLVDIIRTNQRFQRKTRGCWLLQLIIEGPVELLQYHVTTFFDNDIRCSSLQTQIRKTT
ncbi:MAG: hypothetical protein R2741_09160 [Methanolobus sp.]